MNAKSADLVASLLVLGALTSVSAVVGAVELKAEVTRAQPPSLGQRLERFQLDARALVEVADTVGSDRRLRAYLYKTVIDGPRYRIEVSSEGAEIGVLPRSYIAYDGQQTWVEVPGSDIVSVRTGDLEGQPPVAIPDPLLLQFRALRALEDVDAARELSVRAFGRDRHLVDRLENLARSEAALAAASNVNGAAVTIRRSVGGGQLEIRWRQEGDRWVPSSFRGSGLWRGKGSVEWEVLEFFPANEAGGVAGIPRRVEYRASDPDEGERSELRIQFEVTAFEPGFASDVSMFRLDNSLGDSRLWDEDAKMFLRP